MVRRFVDTEMDRQVANTKVVGHRLMECIKTVMASTCTS